MNINTILTAAFFCFILCAAARADDQIDSTAALDSTRDSSDAAAASSNDDNSSKNAAKTERFLPGEEVVTATGKKVKVWSTEGPVPVSSAPEPFEDREKTVIEGTGLLIDQRSRGRH